MEKIVYKFDEIAQISLKLLKKKESKLLCLYGSMGVGKTTLVKSLLKKLGAVDTGNSPTFGLVNEYHDKKGSLIAYHFDFYRINNEKEALDMGLEDYWSKDVFVFIEWPDKIPNLLPQNHQKVYLQFIDETTRSIEF